MNSGFSGLTAAFLAVWIGVFLFGVGWLMLPVMRRVGGIAGGGGWTGHSGPRPWVWLVGGGMAAILALELTRWVLPRDRSLWGEPGFTLLAPIALMTFGAGLRGWVQDRGWRSMHLRGVAAALAPGLIWLVAYANVVLLVYWTQGRWPNFGEAVPAWISAILAVVAASLGFLVLTSAAIAVPVMWVALWVPRWHRWAGYAGLYGVGVGLAWGGLFLAPDPFLNWLFD